MPTQAILVQRPGGPEVLQLADVELPPLAPNEVRVRQTAIGLNFIDVYYRSGLYPPPHWPYIPGLEGAGVITELGRDVGSLQIGERVAYATRPLGAYARERNLPAYRLVRIPGGIEDRVAAAVLFKGLTAEYLLRRLVRLQRGAWILVHSAAGGVGSLMVQWASELGLRVIGTVSSEAKAEQARADGAEEVILVPGEDFVERTLHFTGGAGCEAVYDAVGRDTFLLSMQCVGLCGTLASYGQSSGPIAPFDISVLVNNSIFLTRPSLFHYIGEDDEYQHAAAEVFRLVAKGVLKCRVGQTYPLHEAAHAHAALESRQTVGSTLLLA